MNWLKVKIENLIFIKKYDEIKRYLLVIMQVVSINMVQEMFSLEQKQDKVINMETIMCSLDTEVGSSIRVISTLRMEIITSS